MTLTYIMALWHWLTVWHYCVHLYYAIDNNTLSQYYYDTIKWYWLNWICFILDWIIYKFWFSNVFWPFLEKSSCFMNFISRFEFASFWTGLYINFDLWMFLWPFLKKNRLQDLHYCTMILTYSMALWSSLII
jgi:hypothetical protein